MPTYTGLDQLSERERRRLLRYVPLEPGENLLLYHGTALLFAGNAGTVLTNRRLVSYKKTAVTMLSISDLVVTYDDRTLWLDRGSATEPTRTAFMDFSGEPGWILNTCHRLDSMLTAPEAWIEAARERTRRTVADSSFGLLTFAEVHAGASRPLRQLLRTAARRALASGEIGAARSLEAELRAIAVGDALRATRQCARALVSEAEGLSAEEVTSGSERDYLALEKAGAEVVERLPRTAANRLVTARLLPEAEDPSQGLSALTRIEVLAGENTAPGFAARREASDAPFGPIEAFWLAWTADEKLPEATYKALEALSEMRWLSSLSRLIYTSSEVSYSQEHSESDIAILLESEAPAVLACAALLPVYALRAGERVAEASERALWEKAMGGDEEVQLVARLIQGVRECSTTRVAAPEYATAVSSLGDVSRAASARLGL